MFERARERLVNGLHHRHAILAFAAWPLSFWRFDPLDERDFDWFESKYRAGTPSTAGSGRRSAAAPTPARVPPLDFINMAAAVLLDLQGCASQKVIGPPDRRPADAVLLLQGVPVARRVNPGRYTGTQLLDRYHGWEASAVIEDLGFVRADGETLIGQPHLGDEHRWTLSDIRAHNLALQSPNIGSRVSWAAEWHWSDAPRSDGAVPLAHAQAIL